MTEKVTGHVRYVADLKLPGMLYARPVLSPCAHALIVSIDKSAAEAMPGVVAGGAGFADGAIVP